MVKKIAGEYIAELEVILDKKSQSKQADSMFKQHVSNLKKQNNHTVKQAEKTGKQSAEAEQKGSDKVVKKRKGKAGGVLRSLSKIALLGKDFTKNIPIIGSFVGGLSGLALAGRFLTSDPSSTMDKITETSNSSKSTVSLADLLNINPSKIQNMVDDLQHKGLSKEQAINTLEQIARKTGNVNNSSYLDSALQNYKQQNSILGKESVAKSYGFSTDVLGNLSVFDKVKNQTYTDKKGKTKHIGDYETTPISYQEDKNLNKSAGFSIVANQTELDNEFRNQELVVKQLNEQFGTLIDNIKRINNIEYSKFETKIETIEGQIRGLATMTTITNTLDKITNKIATGDTVAIKEYKKLTDAVVKVFKDFTVENNKPKPKFSDGNTSLSTYTTGLKN